MKENYEIANNLIIHAHHLIRSSRFIAQDKLKSIKMNSMLISKVQSKLFSNFYLPLTYQQFKINN